MKKTISRAIIVVCLLAFFVVSAGAVWLCDVEAANVRRGPGTQYDIIGQLMYNDMFAGRTVAGNPNWLVGTPGEDTALYQQFGRITGYVLKELMYEYLIK